jgi:hypothetical protein
MHRHLFYMRKEADVAGKRGGRSLMEKGCCIISTCRYRSVYCDKIFKLRFNYPYPPFHLQENLFHPHYFFTAVLMRERC